MDPLDAIESEISGIHESIDNAGGPVALYLMRSEHAPSFQKRAKLTTPRWSISRGHLAHLEAVFEEVRTPSMAQRQQLAQQLGVTTRQVQVWFRNRRQRVRLASLAGGPYERPIDGKDSDDEEKTSHNGRKFKEQHALSRPPPAPISQADLADAFATQKPLPACDERYRAALPSYYGGYNNRIEDLAAMPRMLPPPTYLGSIPERVAYDPPSSSYVDCTAPCVVGKFTAASAAPNIPTGKLEAPGSPTGSHGGDTAEMHAHLGPPHQAARSHNEASHTRPPRAGEGAVPSRPGGISRPESIASMMSSNGSSPDTTVRQGMAFSDLPYPNREALHNMAAIAPSIVPAMPPFSGAPAVNMFPSSVPNFGCMLGMPMAITQQGAPTSANNASLATTHPAIKEAVRTLLGEYMVHEAQQRAPHVHCPQRAMAAQMAIHHAVETAVQRHATTLVNSHLIGAQAMPPPPSVPMTNNSRLSHLPTLGNMAAPALSAPALSAPALSAPALSAPPLPTAIPTPTPHYIDSAELDGLLAHPSGELNAFFDDIFKE